jgi:hypothetical protein
MFLHKLIIFCNFYNSHKNLKNENKKHRKTSKIRKKKSMFFYVFFPLNFMKNIEKENIENIEIHPKIKLNVKQID